MEESCLHFLLLTAVFTVVLYAFSLMPSMHLQALPVGEQWVL